MIEIILNRVMGSKGVKLFLIIAFSFLIQIQGRSQATGGRSKLDFLQLPAQAHSNATGINHFTSASHDPALFFQSPTQLDTSKADRASVNIMPYLADTKFINLAYAHSLKKTGGTWGVGIQYLNYGTMTETDAIGNVIGEFRAADYGFSAGYGHTLGPFTLGASLKMVGASVDAFQTWGMAFDWGGIFRHPKEEFTIGFVVKNMGFLKQNFYGATDPTLPLDVRLGFTLKPKYMPLRFSATIHHLNNFDMVYNDPALFFTYDSNGNKIQKKIKTAEKLGRHLALGVEALIHPSFRIMAGYDHLRRQELRLVDKGALAGFSFGAWLRIKRFEVGYGRAQYMPGIGTSSLSIVMDIRKSK